MSILIRGMEMPTRGHTITITIVGSGQAYVEYFDCRPHVEETIEYTAVPVPPHGRLIDADMMEKECCHGCKNEFHKYENCIDCVLANAPTIIPAEEESNG